MRFSIIIFSLLTIGKIEGFLRLPLGSPFVIKNNEIKRNIKYDLPEEDMKVVKQIKGVYGIIGPDINNTEVENLYHLFTGDGTIQGVFFDKGELTFVKHFVRTDKIVYEEKCGRLLRNRFINLLFILLSKVNLLPDILGVANTALVSIGDKHYALYERDQPYEIRLYNKSIQTLNKKRIQGITHFSAHPSISTSRNLVETLDYNVLKKTVSFYQLSTELVLQKRIEIATTYLPIVHDFISTRYNYIVLDAPLSIEFSEMHNKTMPVSLMKGPPAFIRVVNKYTGRVRTYNAQDSFYIFHYAHIKEDENRIKIYAPCYDDMDFSSLDIKGRYRELVLDKYTGLVCINKNDELENLNLDFPMAYEDKVVLRNIKDRICNGFVICRNLEIVHSIWLQNRFVCGEPRIIYVDFVPYLIFFTFDISSPDQDTTNKGFITLINLHDYKQIEIPLGSPIQYGFHSFFVNP
jgi:hypothetical protein